MIAQKHYAINGMHRGQRISVYSINYFEINFIIYLSLIGRLVGPLSKALNNTFERNYLLNNRIPLFSEVIK